jgi:hypothetical protein
MDKRLGGPQNLITLDAVEKRNKILSLLGKLNLDSLAVQRLAWQLHSLSYSGTS